VTNAAKQSCRPPKGGRSETLATCRLRSQLPSVVKATICSKPALSPGVDLQAGVGLVGSALGGGPALSRTFHAALEASIATHFPGNHAINCMCHSTENLYRWGGYL
jgi:hypothetical protein